MSKRKPVETQLIEAEDDRKYFHMMLNMADDDLNPHQYRLLGHYLRWAGHGRSAPKSLRESAKATRMGINKVRSTRQELVGMGYLKVQEPSEDEMKNGVPAIITVVDRWQENINRYAKTCIQSDTPPVSDQIQGTPETRIQTDTPPVSNETHSEERIEKPKEPVAHSDEQVNKPQRKSDPMWDAISIIWNTTARGYIGNMKAMMLGKSKNGDWAKCNFDPPATPEQLHGYRDWWKKYHPDTIFPTRAETIQRRFYEYRETLKAKPDQEAAAAKRRADIEAAQRISAMIATGNYDDQEEAS